MIRRVRGREKGGFEQGALGFPVRRSVGWWIGSIPSVIDIQLR